MIIDCFVETKESRLADFSLERITKNVLGNMALNERDVGEGLKVIIRDAVAGEPGQTVFIVGPSGAGKSTFLDRFFKRTLTSEVRERCVVIDVDVLDASGDEAVALPWMTERAIKSIETQLFSEGYPEWNDLQGLYHLSILNARKGLMPSCMQEIKTPSGKNLPAMLRSRWNGIERTTSTAYCRT
jgi:hypothetical protein